MSPLFNPPAPVSSSSSSFSSVSLNSNFAFCVQNPSRSLVRSLESLSRRLKTFFGAAEEAMAKAMERQSLDVKK